jgi:sugar/nucleoside kinase (ribokinase family)
MDVELGDGSESAHRGAQRFDVVGIGALNLDYIVNASTPLASEGHGPLLATRLARLFADRSIDFKWGAELMADEETVYAALEEINTSSVDASLGGSAFNAMIALARMQLDLNIGYVGVAGRIPVFGLSCQQVFNDLGIDDSFVNYHQGKLSGVCLAIQDGDDRTLCTHGGANLMMASFIREKRESLAQYLSRAKIIHLTSFLDDATPGELVSLLAIVRDINPNVIISFDPGHVWATNTTPAIGGLVSMSNNLLLNSHEFRAFGESSAGDTDESIASRILGRIRSADAVVTVKRSDRILNFRRIGGKLAQETVSHTPLRPDQVRDSTGAGDVFAAGVLAAIASNRLQIELGSVLGMRLARHKLGYVGTHGHSEFAEITRSILRSFRSEPERRDGPTGVFIGHGRNPQWLAVKEFISSECGMPVAAFDTGAWSGKAVTEALTRYLDQCSFAVCVLTAEDVTGAQLEWARQNVVHEVGLFQGRYGTRRVALLVEEGCAFVPAAPTEHIIKFPKGAIEATFWRLRALLRAELSDAQN